MDRIIKEIEVHRDTIAWLQRRDVGDILDCNDRLMIITYMLDELLSRVEDREVIPHNFLKLVGSSLAEIESEYFQSRKDKNDDICIWFN